MSNPVSVKAFSYEMSGAPALSYVNGSLISLLDACLKDGFGSVTLSSLVVASGVATATVNTGHGFDDYAVILIAGATPSGLNGDKRITVTGANTFTFDATGISNQTATGTITAKISPLGWEKVYSGTNKAVYRPQDTSGTRRYYRFDDTVANVNYRLSSVIGYESMSDVDTGVNPFPASAWYIFKNYLPNDTNIPWVLIGDGSAFYLLVWVYSLYWSHCHFFGDVVSVVPDDPYRAAIISNYGTSPASECRFSTINNSLSSGHALCRNAVGSAGAVAFATFSAAITPTYMGVGGVPYPNRANNGLLVAPVFLNEGGIIRGALPGCYSPLHNTSLPNGVFVVSDEGLVGRMLYVSAMYTTTDNSARAAFDITGPWR
ncbi:MAG: hypothetical protein RKP73_01790 [Candidatus Contendobacter sp.]|nr:hypothetical protein [Candidatus Contendobacter sp.]